MKKIGIFIFLLFLHVSSFACEVCKARQPAGWKTHGTGPQGTIDMIIIWGAVAIVGVTLVLSIRYLVAPRESTPDHIKNSIIG